MKKFDESLLLESGMSAEDYFADEENQQNIMDEIAEFQDEELATAFSRLFNPPAREDAYLTGRIKITAEEVAKMHVLPEGHIQAEVASGGTAEMVQALFKLGRLCPDAELALFRRGDMALIEQSLANGVPYASTLETLVRAAAKDGEMPAITAKRQVIARQVLPLVFQKCPYLPYRAEEALVLAAEQSEEMKQLFIAYVKQHCLSLYLQEKMIRQKRLALLGLYFQYQSAEALLRFMPRMGWNDIKSFFKLLQRPEDKLFFALYVRGSVINATSLFPFCRILTGFIRQIGAKAKLPGVITQWMSPEEQCALVTHPNKQLLRCYRRELCPAAQEELIRHAPMPQFNFYIEQRRLDSDSVKMIIRENYFEQFRSYVRHYPLNELMQNYLEKFGSEEAIAFYRRLYPGKSGATRKKA